MKNNLFRQATVLVMGSLVIFSGQALAFSSNNQKNTITGDAWGNFESMIAQEGVSVSAAVAIAVEALGQAVTVVRTAAVNRRIPPELAPLVQRRLAEAQSSLATARSSANRGDNFATAQAVAVAISALGEGARAVATADAGSAQAIAEAIAKSREARAAALGQAGS